MAVYNIDALNPLQGKDIGIILGAQHSAVVPTGDVNNSNKSFIISSSMLPLFDMDGGGPPSDKDDMEFTVDGSAVTVSSWVESTGTVTLASAPSSTAKIAVTFYEEKEPYIAHTLKVDAKYDEKTIGRLRSAAKKKIYGAREVTISVDLYLVDTEFLSLFFDSSTGAMLTTPPQVYGYIPMDVEGVEIGRIYFTECRMIPKSLLDVKEGDIAGYSLEISVSEDPILWEATP